MEKDKRKHQRIPVQINVETWPIPKLKGYKITAQDMTAAGMLIEIIPAIKDNLDLKVGDIITVSFLIPIQNDYINVSSRIVWMKYKFEIPEGKEATHLGVKFVITSDLMEMKILEYLKVISSGKA